ncbi:putative dna repair protein rad57 protein [Echria macrotheca]|uniref:Dna repair protein rad57 protein n=1 Tax=Echria macrotheca TaxID=438768 RepID=A0AAJ0FHU2_9PEZI|nr:putative dna repair protein rad57 protein [Echria macrotheca]
MTDLLRVLPDFPVGPYARLITVLEKHGFTTTDLVTLDAAAIGKRTQLPLLDIQRLSSAVLDALHADLGVATKVTHSDDVGPPARLKNTAETLATRWHTFSTLDDTLDGALGGGIPTGYVTEITGESGAGKTQFLLTLLLAVQLPPPRGLGKSALYISTEAALSTRRLAQILSANPTIQSTPADSRPSLDNVMSQVTPDLESQDHIIAFQVPVAIERRNVGLLVLDSVAANFRAEFERASGQRQSASMGARSAELIRLGMQLHELARKYNIAIVVANQVADRFGGGIGSTGTGPKTPLTFASSSAQVKGTPSSPLAMRSKPPPPPQTTTAAADTGGVEPPSSMREILAAPPPPPTFPYDEGGPPSHPALTLDHQQRWFTGWGDDPDGSDHPMKTPSLGLIWASQISARIALFKRPVHHYGGRSRYTLDGEEEDERRRQGMPTMRMWRRWMKVVFAPHARPSDPGTGEGGAVEFEVTTGGVRAVTVGKKAAELG